MKKKECLQLDDEANERRAKRYSACLRKCERAAFIGDADQVVTAEQGVLENKVLEMEATKCDFLGPP